MKHTKELIRKVISNQPRVTSEEAYRQMDGHMRTARAQKRSSESPIVLTVPAQKNAPPVAESE